MGDKSRYGIMIESAKREKDPEKKVGWVITILDMICTNDLFHIGSYVKKVDKKLNVLLVLGGLILLYLFITESNLLDFIKAVK